MKPYFLAFAAAATLIGPAASAHIVFAQPTAAPGGYVGALRITHGCGASPTTALAVTIPAGIDNAKPQAKAGWTIEITREPLRNPTRSESGAAVTERVKAITWRGRLPVDQFDEVGLSFTVPASVGPLYFPTVQRCEAGENRWTDIPAAGAKWTSVPRPAPVITLTGSSGGAAPMPGIDMGTMSGMAH